MLYSLLLTAAVANAHLFIRTPSPIPNSAPKDPLMPDGSNFPCHGATLPGTGGVSMPVGSTQPLIFDDGDGANWAVHGGGSCQISVTYETDPAKIRDPMNWFVIHSVEGGCPTNSLLNLNGMYPGPGGQYTGAHQCNDTSTNGVDCINQFEFQIPKGMKGGQATLAWTWFNNIGNREMYMNCVAIDITGGANNDDGMQDLPGLFVANLNGNGLPACASTEGQNVKFPQPGPVCESRKPAPRMTVDTKTLAGYPLSPPTGSCPNLARNGLGSSPPTIISGGSSSEPASAAVPSLSAAASAQSPSTIYVNTGSPVTPTDAPASDSDSDIDSGSCAAGSVPCDTPGALVCPDSLHFGICDITNCAVVGSVAAGTLCKNGAIAFADAQKREAVHKRLVRYARHAHHRRS